MSIFYLELIIILNDVETLLKISNNFLKKTFWLNLILFRIDFLGLLTDGDGGEKVSDP